MASLGTFLLLASFVTCSYAAVVSVAGARRRSRRLIESGIGAFYLICALMTAVESSLPRAGVLRTLNLYSSESRLRIIEPGTT